MAINLSYTLISLITLTILIISFLSWLILRTLIEGRKALKEINEDSPLVGGNSNIDSMGLVQLCIALEEKAIDLGFEFDWTSEKAMSSMNSVFRSPKSLLKEFKRQQANHKKK